MQQHVLGSSTLKALLEDPNLKKPPLVGLYDKLKIKKEDLTSLPQINYGSAFLGPNLWDRSVNNSDFNLEYMDLDEFLSENCITFNNDVSFKEPPVGDGKIEETVGNLNADQKQSSLCQLPQSPCQYLKSNTPSPAEDYHICVTQLNDSTSSIIPFNVGFQVNEQEFLITPLSRDSHFDPQARNFTEEELKPQPVIKKAKKIFVPEKLKDEKYWTRRHKNNFAARRSRDARRIKENQIALRAAFLEKENCSLREEMTELRKENAKLKMKVAKYEVSSCLESS